MRPSADSSSAGSGMLAGFRGALPALEEEQDNLMRGVLPGGRWGVLLHEV